MLVQSHFGLRGRPFRASPDAGSYYPASGHETAFAAVTDALAAGDGFAALTAAPGLGKSLLAQRLAERLDADHDVCLITNPHFARPADLFQAVLFDLGLPFEGKSEQELRLALTARLVERFAAGTPTIVIVDEAQHLSPALLEELRLLGNLESRRGKALQVVLIGLPALLDTLAEPRLAALAQRVSTRAVVPPLEGAEGADYLLHQLRVAGARPEAIVTDEAVELIARAANGVPRLLNQLGWAALRVACDADAGRADAEAAYEAVSRVLPGLAVEDELPASVPLPAADDADVGEWRSLAAGRLG